MTVCKMEHLTDIRSLDKETVDFFLSKAKNFKENGFKPTCKGKHVALMFFENSTRTRFSFEMAISRLGAVFHNFDTTKSSLSKGEDFFDTINNLSAIGYDAVVIRQNAEGLIKFTVENIKKGKTFFGSTALINAGEGTLSHPTQALLDLYTLKEKLGPLEGKTVAIVGDILHSRVARSDINLFKMFGINTVCVAPEYFADETITGVRWSDNLEQTLITADAVIALRIQKERMHNIVEIADYVSKYQITKENLPSNCILMHPGPVNRDVEVSAGLIDSARGKIILEQAHNGVFVRMAVIDTILGEKNV